MDKQRRYLYEGMYVISATLSEEARSKALDKIKDGITSKEGEINKIHDMGRRKLAYPINGRREGYYYLVYFTTPSQAVDEMWIEYQINEDLLRFMTLRADSVMEKIEFKPLVEAQ